MSAVAHIDQYKTGQFYTDGYRGDRSWNGYERNVLLRNEGADDSGHLKFVDVSVVSGLDDIKDARGLALADYDNDGDVDVVVNNNPGDLPERTAKAIYLKNVLGNRRRWLAVDLVGTACNRDAIGALVTVEHRKGSRVHRQLRQVSAGSGFASQQSRRLYFGLDESPLVKRLSVRWPGGREESFENVEANQLVRITESSGVDFLGLPGRRDTVKNSVNSN